ncbi:centrosomal protein of 152 kDa isoform X2 [Hippocampus comes]|uniref:centrosomal protein of 152 kDa isoform X2 n=1 Tax=Hippocampus comes TaxID=109280 RepID=UPI00094EF56D|nr:PREDICTED: centrosomal protein of 152 kDa isoform X2 [Hippocampus comes]
MSIDFDSAALQTQDDEEEYDKDDYAREQELHKLLADLPDDMLEDSRDSSSIDLESSTCSKKNPETSPTSKWTHQRSNHPRATSDEQSYEADYDQPPHGFTYMNGGVQINGHQHHAQTQPSARMWNQHSQDSHFTQEDYTFNSKGTEQSTEANDFSTNDPYEQHPGASNLVDYNEGGASDDCDDGDCNNPRVHFKSGAAERRGDDYPASYNPHLPPRQMLSSQATRQDQPFDQLQREFLDSTQQTAEKEQLVQLQILNKAHHRQIEDLEQKLVDSKRKIRYLEHRLAIAIDERDGFAARFKESSRLLDEAKEREVKKQSKEKVMEDQIRTLNDRDQEHINKQRVAEAAADAMKQQILELSRSDTLSKARKQHDRDVTVIKEQHEAALLVLQQQLDAMSQALDEQMDTSQRFREQVKQLERQREEEQLERARVVSALTQSLEESQQQCAKLLQTNSVQEMSQIQLKLQQAQTAKVLSEDMNRVLQEDLADLKEQITLYESALKLGVIALDPNSDCQTQLSESCLALGFKKTTFRNGSLHSMALATLSDSKLPQDEALRLLRVEMQRCLGSQKAKRQKVSHLQEELQRSRTRVNELQTQLDEANLSSLVRQSSQIKPYLNGEDQNELVKLQEDKQRLQDQVEVLEKKIDELQQSEEKLRSSNLELCVKMREMIQELDQEKQEAAQRSERINQQHRDDVVNRVRTELMLKHDAHVEHLTAEHEQHIQRLNTQLSEASDKVSAVQECYISVCKEKEILEESIKNAAREDALRKENEQQKSEESSTDVEKLRTELEAQHRASVAQLKALWSKEHEAEIQQQVNSQVASAKVAWDEAHRQMEKTWTLRLEEARREKHSETSEVTCQTEEAAANGLMITVEELDSRLCAQRQQLQVEADKVQRQAVEEAKKQVQKETQDKHLEDLADKVEGAVTRAYNRWIEDLTSLPEYQASLQRERENWEELQKQYVEQQVSQSLRTAEEQWHKQQEGRLKAQSCGTSEELQQKVVSLQCQLEQLRREQATLLKAELAGAKAAWKRDKQQEISVVQTRSEQMYQTKLQEQHKKQELALLQAREEADLQKKELLQQMETKLQQIMRAREDEWKCQQAEKEQAQRRQMREDFLTELQTALAEVQAQLLGSSRTDQQSLRESGTGRISEGGLMDVIQSCCIDIVDRAVCQAKKDWKKISEAQLSCVLRETQQQHKKEISKMQSSLAQIGGQVCSRKDCADTASKLQKKNQELQKHLEKACRQFQHSVREHKMTMQKLRDEHEGRLQKANEEHRLQLEEMKRSKEAAGSNHQQSLQEGLEEMKQQYLTTVEKIRGDMLRYLQESRERAGEMIRTEVQRERQDTARKMRRYYLTCLQELLEDGGKTTGAEKKIMNAASKLAAMAKVLETPVKNKAAKTHSLPTCTMDVSTTGSCPTSNTHFLKNPSTLSEDRTHREKMSDLEQKTTPARIKCVSKQDAGACESSAEAQVYPHKVATSCLAPLKSKSREAYLQGGQPEYHADRPNNPSLAQELPVRDDRRTNWSLTSSDSDSLHIPRVSFSGRKVESVKPFSVSVADFGEFDHLTPDTSDLTVYNDIAQETRTWTQTSAPKAKINTHREPTPGSEGEKQSGALFSELRRQQDSGFDSPLNQAK